MTALKTEFLRYKDSKTGIEQLYEVIPPAPTESDRGGIIASPKTDTETVEAKIGEDGKLYVPEGIKDYNQLENVPTKLSYFENDLNIVTSWNELEDRPFYEAEEIILSEATVDDFVEYDIESNIFYSDKMDTYAKTSEGDTFNVLFDGEMYYVTCVQSDNIGNLHFIDIDAEDTGEPFLINFGRYTQFIYTNRSGTSHTVGIIKNNIVKLDEKFIPDTIARIDDISEQIQTDWNQNDESAIDYMKNRTHYVTYDDLAIDNQTVSGVTTEGESNISQIAVIKPLIEDSVCIVIDGVKYENVPYINPNPDVATLSSISGIHVYGDAELDGGAWIFNELPFVLLVYSNFVDEYNAYLAFKDNNTDEHTVSLYLPTVHQLDEKFLPNTTKYQSDWNVNDENDINYIRNRPFYSNFEDIVVIDNKQVEFTAKEGYENLFFSYSRVDKTLESNLEYKIIWNGKTYYAKPYLMDGSPLLGAEIIDPSTMTIDFSKYPFIIMIQNAHKVAQNAMPYASGAALIYTNSGEATTISITAKKEIVNKMPDKYLSQPNWGEIDKSKASYIANKPFGDKIIDETVIVELIEINTVGQFANIYKPLYIEAGKTYHVTFNGIVYTCVAWSGDYGLICIGNGSLLEDEYDGKGENVPFSISTFKGSEEQFSLFVAEDGNHIFKVSEGTVETTPINERYIPEMTSLVLLSPNGTRFSITVGDDGVLTATEITK